MLPLVLAVGLVLLLQGWHRAAAVWLMVIVATFGTVLALKLIFLGCPGAFDVTDIRTPSGHVAAATVVVGGLPTLMHWRRSIVLMLAALAACLIGWTRLILGEHTLPETVLGGLVGFAGVIALVWLVGQPPPRFSLWRVVLVAVAAALLFHGMHMPAEARIHASAHRAMQILGVCQSVDEVRR